MNNNWTEIAEDYINANYNIKGNLTYETVNGVCIVNCDGDVEVKNKKIKKLTDGFEWGKVKGDFDCSECKNLKSLEGAPKEVGSFYCSLCSKLVSLKGAPKYINIDFYCTDCTKLESLEGAPEYIGGEFLIIKY